LRAPAEKGLGQRADPLVNLVGGDRLPLAKLVLPEHGARVGGRGDAAKQVIDSGAASAVGLLLCALSLEFSESHYSNRVNWLSKLLALLAALLGMAILAEYTLHLSAGLERFFPFDPNSASPWPDRPSPQTASGLALLGITLALIRVRSRIAVRIADLVAICLGLLVLVLVSGEIFGAMRIFGHIPHYPHFAANSRLPRDPHVYRLSSPSPRLASFRFSSAAASVQGLPAPSGHLPLCCRFCARPEEPACL
jgi:hypothetical protein